MSSWGTPWTERQGPPQIDLLPRRLVEQRLVRRQRTGIGAGFLVLLAVLGIWYALEAKALHGARAEADREQATATGLRAQRAQLQPLADLEAQIAAAEQLRAAVYRKEIRFSGVMRDISTIVPEDVWLTSMAVAFAGAGLEHVDVGGFLRALARGPKKGGAQVYLNPYFTTSQKADETGQAMVTFSATVDLSSAAYSGRYQPAGTVTP